MHCRCCFLVSYASLDHTSYSTVRRYGSDQNMSHMSHWVVSISASSIGEWWVHVRGEYRGHSGILPGILLGFRRLLFEFSPCPCGCWLLLAPNARCWALLAAFCAKKGCITLFIAFRVREDCKALPRVYSLRRSALDHYTSFANKYFVWGHFAVVVWEGDVFGFFVFLMW